MGTVLVAIIGAVAIIAAALINASSRRADREAIREVGVAVQRVAVDAAASNEAVNHKEHGMPTLVQRVTEQDVASQAIARDLRAFRDWQSEALERIAKEVGVELPQQPPHAVTKPMARPSSG